METERLLLRTWREEDREPFAELNADPEVMRHFPNLLDRAASDAFVDRIIAGLETNGFGLWAVQRKDDGTFIGFVGLAVPRFDAPFMPTVEIGWRLARSAWGHGFATEAGRWVLRVAFTELGLDEVVSFTTVANERSRAVMRRLGMRHDPAGDFEHPSVPVGSPVRPHVLYRLTREQWLQEASQQS